MIAFSRIRRLLFKVLLPGALLVIIIVLIVYFTNREVRVARGVEFNGVEIEGYTEEEVERLVRHMAPRESIVPLNAQIDYNQELIIPEIFGQEINIEKTVTRIMEAESGQKVKPVLVEIEPSVTWNDYPALPAYKGNSARKGVSFMINVAWGEEYLEDMLATLDEEGVKATFFVTGKWGEKNPQELRRLYKKGHELGSHGYSSEDVMPDLDWKSVEESLSKTNEIIYSLTGRKPQYFTPHMGEYNHMTLELVYRHSMKTVLWSLDTVDWQEPGVDQMEQKIRDNVSAGDIMLMHPTAGTAELLPRVIPILKEKELQVVPVGELLSAQPDALQN